MKSNEIREKFLTFFEEKNHEVLKSYPLVPKNDDSILWINAGMTPLKRYFKGEVEPTSKRLTSSQRCVRTNDIENVGRTPRHQTMFEMLGNFSIGDYFKLDAIRFAYEFLTKHLMLDRKRLYITVYEDDRETLDIWTKTIGILPEHVLKTREDNFWDIGEGPCGPCTEIFYDTKPEMGRENWHPDLYDGTRYLEIWNLVFSELNHNSDGTYTELPKKNIDTGAGLERLSMVMQNVKNNFETDLFTPIIEKLGELSKVTYKETEDTIVSYHAISDHIRSVTMMLYDGEKPSNTERGYVIRRLIRRSMRFGKKLGFEHTFLSQLVPTIVQLLKSVEPEIKEKEKEISSIIQNEEERFLKVLVRGERILNRKIKYLRERGGDTLSGKDVFMLHDTNGFPFDLIEEICFEENVKIDKEEFERLLEEQKEKSKK